jgi:hypothetical protein
MHRHETESLKSHQHHCETTNLKYFVLLSNNDTFQWEKVYALSTHTQYVKTVPFNKDTLKI